VLGAHEEVAAWLGLSAAGPGRPAAPVPRREPPSREPPDPRECVRVGAVLIGRYPVTNAAYGIDDPQLAAHPVVNVTRAQAAAFCARLGGRLPTRAEWEAAAGPTTWPWGDTFDPARCNCVEAGWGWTTPVRAFDQGPGAQDLAGNVWEWIADEDIVKGGCYLDTAYGLVSARSLPTDPDLATRTTGFRIVFEGGHGWTARSS
jgi:formylglycine-generating enzyme required for sulfatase activity